MTSTSAVRVQLERDGFRLDVDVEWSERVAVIFGPSSLQIPDTDVIRPDVSVCMDCHDEEYADMGTEWSEEVSDLSNQVAALLGGLPASLRSHPDAERARRVHNDLDRYSAGGLHNYELASGLLSEVRRTLQDLGDSQ